MAHKFTDNKAEENIRTVLVTGMGVLLNPFVTLS